MSMICEILLGVGLTFGGVCGADAPEGPPRVLPKEDMAAWSFKTPPPPPPPPPIPESEPEAPPEFPPVVIREVVRQEVKVEQPPPAPAPEPPDPWQDYMQLALATRHSTASYWTPVGTGRAVRAGADGSEAALFEPPSLPSVPSIADDAGLGAEIARERDQRYKAPRRVSSLPVDNDRILARDRYILGIIETGINSRLSSGEGGDIIIQTARDVFGYHGRNILIPKGSRLICGYSTPEQANQTRIPVDCERVLMGETRAEILQLETRVGDVQGRGGVTGDVDKRFWEKYGTAFLLSGISAAVRLAASETGSATQAGSSVADKGAEELGERLGEITASVLEETVDLNWVITIPQGTRVQLRPRYDWYLKRIDDAAPAIMSAEAQNQGVSEQ